MTTTPTGPMTGNGEKAAPALALSGTENVTVHETSDIKIELRRVFGRAVDADDAEYIVVGLYTGGNDFPQSPGYYPDFHNIPVRLAAMPTAAPTAPTEGPSTYEQSWMDGYCEGHEEGWQSGLRSSPTPPLTTPEPDGLAERVAALEDTVRYESGLRQELKSDAVLSLDGAWEHEKEINAHTKRLDAHDAALAELREEVKRAQERDDAITQALGELCEAVDPVRGYSPTPPAAPDADGLAERVARLEEQVRESDLSSANLLVKHDAQLTTHLWWFQRMKEGLVPTQAIVYASEGPTDEDVYGLTPAPPPLVVSDELVKVAVNSWRRTLSDGFTGKYVIMGYALDAAAQHWNATHVPAGDDLGDTLAAGGE